MSVVVILLFVIIWIVRAQYNSITPISITISRNYLEKESNADILLEVDKSKLDGELTEVCDDVKFLNGSNYPIPYFIESGCNSSQPLQIWLRFDSNVLLSSMMQEINQTEVNLTMYHGNPLVFLDEKTNRQNLDGNIIFPTINETTKCPPTFYRSLEEWTGYFPKSTTSTNNIGDVGGSSTHNHQYNQESGVCDPYQQWKVYCPGHSQQNRAARDHKHVINLPSDEKSNIPDHISLPFCAARMNIPFEIYPGMIIHSRDLSSSSSSSEWTRYSEIDDLYMRIGSEENGISISRSIDSDNKHSHIISGKTDGPIDSFSNVYIHHYLYQTTTNTHNHDVIIGTNNQTFQPSHVTSRTYYSNVQSTNIPKDRIIIISNSSIVPFGYISLNSDFGDNFVRNDDSFGSTSGTDTHSHTLYGSYMYQTNAANKVNTHYFDSYDPHECFTSKSDHKHIVNIGVSTEDTSSHIPPFVKLRYFERKKVNASDPNEYYFTEIFYDRTKQRNWSCDGIPSTSENVCNQKGKCFKSDSCFCNPQYHGFICSEKISGYGKYNDWNTIEVDFEIRISEIDRYGYSEQMSSKFNCSLMIENYEILGISSECVWIAESLLLTKSLLIRSVSSVIAINEIQLKPISKQNDIVYVYITPLPVHNIATVDDDKDDKGSNAGGIIAVSITLPLLFLSFMVICGGIVVVILSCIPICCCLLCSCCLICCLFSSVYSQRKRLKMFNEIEDIELILKEQEHASDKSIAHLTINKSLFEVEYKDIKIEKKIGAGGSFSVVFLAEWKSRRVAFKCFRTTDLCSDDNQFEEFEREVSILASVSHPNILSFYGATLKPPRVGILMEYCVNGDMRVFLKQYNEDNGEKLGFKEKYRMLVEVCSAMSYIHSKNIIHRDLKLDNVLVTKNLITKLMDFGLSKVIQTIQEKKNITKMVGTSTHMAPEVVKGDYSLPCDVFSYSIFIFELFTENYDPYQMKNKFGVELKVANDPDFRPDLTIRQTQESFKNAKFLMRLMQSLWKHEPEDRPTFDEILDRLLNFGSTSEVEIFEEESVERSVKKEEESSKGQSHLHRMTRQFKGSMAIDFERIRRENLALRRLVVQLRKSLTSVQKQLVDSQEKHKKGTSYSRLEEEEGEEEEEDNGEHSRKGAEMKRSFSIVSTKPQRKAPSFPPSSSKPPSSEVTKEVKTKEKPPPSPKITENRRNSELKKKKAPPPPVPVRSDVLFKKEKPPPPPRRNSDALVSLRKKEKVPPPVPVRRESDSRLKRKAPPPPVPPRNTDGM